MRERQKKQVYSNSKLFTFLLGFDKSMGAYIYVYTHLYMYTHMYMYMMGGCMIFQ